MLKQFKPVAYISESDGVTIVVSKQPVDYKDVVAQLTAQGTDASKISPAAPETLPAFVAVGLFEQEAPSAPTARETQSKYRAHFRKPMPVASAKEAEKANHVSSVSPDSNSSLLGG